MEMTGLVACIPLNFVYQTYLLSYFEKIAHMSVVGAYVSLWLCNFVCSDVCCKSQ